LFPSLVRIASSSLESTLGSRLFRQFPQSIPRSSAHLRLRSDRCKKQDKKKQQRNSPTCSSRFSVPGSCFSSYRVQPGKRAGSASLAQGRRVSAPRRERSIEGGAVRFVERGLAPGALSPGPAHLQRLAPRTNSPRFFPTPGANSRSLSDRYSQAWPDPIDPSEKKKEDNRSFARAGRQTCSVPWRSHCVRQQQLQRGLSHQPKRQGATLSIVF
jgi:hypothetical protein